MRWGSWAKLLWLPPVATLAVTTYWGARQVWNFEVGWIPPIAWLFGVILLLVGKPRIGDDEIVKLERSRIAWIGVFVYSLSLGVIEPMRWVQSNRQLGPWFVLLLIPLAWAGVTGVGRRKWLMRAGAWLVLFGQFFTLIYNITNDTSGIGCWSGWVY